tara:strand:- start:2818 stop:4734 length:1917 start_codon:yes stop_codon:yes gene_type:complete
MEEQPDSDAQPVEVQEAEPQEEAAPQEPIRDVETFWSRLDDVLQHLESQPQPGTKPVRSFIYQPELLSVSSQDDSGNETMKNGLAVNPYFFNSFTVKLQKSCVNVKGIQLLRCSFPTPVTNIPDTETTFWYYRFPKYINDGRYYNAGDLVIDPTDGNFYICVITSQFTPPNSNPSFWKLVGAVAPNNSTTGAITAIAPVNSFTFTSITTSAPYFVFYFTTTNPTGLLPGSSFTVSGATSAGFNGTFSVTNTQGTGPGTWAIIATNALQIPPGVSSGGSIVAGGTIYTATSTAGLYVGLPVGVSGATTAAYNGTFNTVTAVTPTSFTINDGLSGASSTATWFAASITKPYLYMIRLQPSWVPPELVGTQYAYNRTFIDYADLSTELIKAATNDPLGSPFTTAGGEYKYLANDVSLNYNATYNKIEATWIDDEIYYLPAGTEDPNLFDAADALYYDTIGVSNVNLGGWSGDGQPYKAIKNGSTSTQGNSNITRTLNMRLGWTWNGNTTSIPNYKNQFRPIPTYTWTNPFNNVLETTPAANIDNFIAPSYACLVNTATVSIFLDPVGGSSQDSTGAAGVLATVPLNTQNNGVGFFDKVLSHKLTKIPSQLQELRFTFQDEQGNPFMLPNSAVVSMVLGVEY